MKLKKKLSKFVFIIEGFQMRWGLTLDSSCAIAVHHVVVTQPITDVKVVKHLLDLLLNINRPFYSFCN